MSDKRDRLLAIMQDAAMGETKATLRDRLAELEAENKRLRKDRDDLARRILSALEPAAQEGRQEAGRIGDAVLDWMVKFDLLDAGNEYYVSDVLAVLNDLTPSTRPSEQAVTEAMVEAACNQLGFGSADSVRIRAALKAAMEAGRHG